MFAPQRGRAPYLVRPSRPQGVWANPPTLLLPMHTGGEFPNAAPHTVSPEDRVASSHNCESNV